ncbi:hypothetical protein [Candidatus Nanohalovita haloferacivicina]|uniref:hypothetical protein n=1 Tax=Candidatus Nanohalovita haloferacivicina TaxID=2978046 RepID=UPI00325FAB13|nr:hypothetical protein HBNXNv_0835 [Candidatus Nanohalobia archaeon BNXNv]
MRAVDSDYENNMDAEADIKITGKTTPSGASQMVKTAISDPSEEVSMTYQWGDRGATTEKLQRDEAAKYLLNVAGASESSAQASGRQEESNYWRKNKDAMFDDSLPESENTQLPNPIKTSIDGEINAGVNYTDGVIGVMLEFDTSYDSDDEEIQDGEMRITYSEPFESNAENELERTQEAIEGLKDLGNLLE